MLSLFAGGPGPSSSSKYLSRKGSDLTATMPTKSNVRQLQIQYCPLVHRRNLVASNFQIQSSKRSVSRLPFLLTLCFSSCLEANKLHTSPNQTSAMYTNLKSNPDIFVDTKTKFPKISRAEEQDMARGINNCMYFESGGH